MSDRYQKALYDGRNRRPWDGLSDRSSYERGLAEAGPSPRTLGATSNTSSGPGPGPVSGYYAAREPVSPALKKGLWVAGLFIVCAFAAISDSNVVYSNLVVSAATQFNRDFAGNSAVAGTERTITAADWLGLPFAFTMEYTTGPVADRPTAGLRGSPRSCSVARITGVLFGRLMMAARSDHMKFCR